jgi:hypothetical protein
MAKSNNYKMIIVTTDLNGSVSGGQYSAGGVVTKWWDGTTSVAVKDANAVTKSNNGTERVFNVLINQGIIRAALQLTNMGMKDIQPKDFSEFSFSQINISTNKLTDLSGVLLPASCTAFIANNNQLSGTFPTLPTSITNIAINNNLYESLPDLDYLNLTALQIGSNPLLKLPKFNIGPIMIIDFSNLLSLEDGEGRLDLSAKTTSLSMNSLILRGNVESPAKFDYLALPGTNHSISGTMDVSYNPLLTDIVNLDYLDMPSSTSTVAGFVANDCNLNIPFPIGLSRGIKRVFINISNNGMSSANVNETIDNWYSGLDNFNNSIDKTLNIGGTNSAVSGTYQMPIGFSYGVSDGSPASQNEKIWVGVNQTVDGSGSGGAKKYKWTVIYN